MIDSSEPDIIHWNFKPIEISELRPVNIIELIQVQEETRGELSSKLILPPSYFPPVDSKTKSGEYLPKILKQLANESDAAHAERVRNHLTIITDQ